MRVLLIEDDATLASAIREYLSRKCCTVDHARTLAEARACLSAPHDIVVLDLGLPDGDGLALLPALHAKPDAPAVLILTARDRLSDRIRGLDAGADDYLVKPFDLPEVAARLRALARRRTGRRVPRIEIGAVIIDPATHEVTLGGVPVALTAHEYAIAETLAQQPRRVFSRTQLEEAIYALDAAGAGSNVVEVYVSRLRRKLGRDAIRTVRGFGYQWGTAEAAPAQAAG